MDISTQKSGDVMPRYMLAVVSHLALLLAWYLFVKFGNVPKYVMPSPEATFAALTDGNYNWWGNVLVTGTEIFAGYFLALITGVALALAFTWSKTLESFFLPLLVSLNMIPKVALGPLIIVWFKYGVFPNAMMAFSICVFPILLTTARGLREIEPDLLDLVRALNGSRWQLFTKIQLPGGGNQRIIYDAVRQMLQQAMPIDPWPAAVPEGRDHIRLEDAVVKTSGQLTCEKSQRNRSARVAITALINKRLLELADGWIFEKR